MDRNPFGMSRYSARCNTLLPCFTVIRFPECKNRVTAILFIIGIINERWDRKFFERASWAIIQEEEEEEEKEEHAKNTDDKDLLLSKSIEKNIFFHRAYFSDIFLPLARNSGHNYCANSLSRCQSTVNLTLRA